LTSEQQAEVQRVRARLDRRAVDRRQDSRHTRAQLHSIVEHVPNFIQIVDTDLRITFVNHIPDDFDSSQIIGRITTFMAPPAERRRVRRKLKRVLATGQPAQYDYYLHSRKGAKVWYRAHAGPIREGERITGAVIIIFDTTVDRKRTESLRRDKQEADAARARDRALLTSIGEGLLVIDEQGTISEINPLAARLLGYDPEELLGQWFPGVAPAYDLNGNVIDPLERPVMLALSSGQAISRTLQYRRKDGSRLPVRVTVSPVVMAGQPIGAIEVMRDLSGERELEQAKEEFVALASHQLRTPATGVKAYISMLLDGYVGELRPEQRSMLQKVFAVNERQLRIVSQLLDVARYDVGKISPEVELVDLVGLLRQVVDEHRPLIEQRQQTIKLLLKQDTVEAMLDPGLVRMVLDNLVDNARKYTPAGGMINLSLKANRNRATIMVQDSGVGIAESSLPHLFQRFSRVGGPADPVQEGVGLGLYLANEIVKQHYGRISVASQPGNGTTFTIELPLGLTTPHSLVTLSAKSERRT
jgi:PAS domain S-box-containing protein